MKVRMASPPWRDPVLKKALSDVDAASRRLATATAARDRAQREADAAEARISSLRQEKHARLRQARQRRADLQDQARKYLASPNPEDRVMGPVYTARQLKQLPPLSVIERNYDDRLSEMRRTHARPKKTEALRARNAVRRAEAELGTARDDLDKVSTAVVAAHMRGVTGKPPRSTRRRSIFRRGRRGGRARRTVEG